MNILELILLALAAAVYPTLLAGVILILSRPKPLRMLVGFLVGGLTTSVVAGLAIVKALESSGAVSKSNHSTNPIVDIAVGALSLVIAWGLWSGHISGGRLKKRKNTARDGAARSPSFTSRALGGGSVTMAVIAGVVLNLPGIWYLDALTGIAKAKPSVSVAVLEILLFNAIMFMLVEIPIAAYLVSPKWAADLVTGLRDWAHGHSRIIGIVVSAAVGAWLIVKGLVNLS